MLSVHYIVNVCGYKTGVIDDMVGVNVQLLMEFKAAYVDEWKENTHHWPENIFHRIRGALQGMAQFTPNGANIY